MTSTAAEKETDHAVASLTEEDTLYSPSPYRFVRCNPRFDQHETIAELTAEINKSPFPLSVPWLDGYYAIPSSFKLQKSKSFQSARLYGQDVSSGAAVAALLSDIYDIDTCNLKVDKSVVHNNNSVRILDLCCCPGLKLCAIADTLYREQTNCDLFGVDISKTRMSVCKRILHKYQIQPLLTQSMSNVDEPGANLGRIRIKLFCDDGKNLATMNCNDLNLAFDSEASFEDEVSRMGKRKRMNKSARAREAKRLKEAAFSVNHSNERNSKLELFDRVLVDAECSTDGSIIHTHKRKTRCHGPLNTDKSRTDGTREMTDGVDCSLGVFDNNQLAKLHDLQRQLAASGFQLLRKGGIMVYSTCSLSDRQNGEIVRWLLNTYPDARVVPLNFFRDTKLNNLTDYSNVVRQGSVPGTIQFLPNSDDHDGPMDYNRLFGGGFFIAKILKACD